MYIPGINPDAVDADAVDSDAVDSDTPVDTDIPGINSPVADADTADTPPLSELPELSELPVEVRSGSDLGLEQSASAPLFLFLFLLRLRRYLERRYPLTDRLRVCTALIRRGWALLPRTCELGGRRRKM